MIAPKAVATSVKSQMWLFAEFTPILSTIVSKIGLARAPGAMATPEQQKSEHEETRREFICFRPPRGIVSGVTRATWNVTVAACGAPCLFLASTLSGLIHAGPPGLVTGAVQGAVFSSIWFGMGITSAGLQVVEGVANTALSPFQQAVRKRRFDQLRGRWVPYTTAPDEYLALFEGTEEIYLAAIRRQQERFGKVDQASGMATSADGRSFYDTLGIPRDASQQDVKDAFKRLAKHLHPDKNPNPEARTQFDEVTIAYKALSDVNARKRYDAGGIKALNQKDEQTKREALRGVFGGKALAEISGDVRTSRFSRRMLEDAYMMHEENLVVIGRQREEVVQRVLKLLEGHPGRSSLNKAEDDQRKKTAAAAGAPEGKSSMKRNPFGSSPSSSSTAASSPSSSSSSSSAGPVATTGVGSYSAWTEKVHKTIKEVAELGVAREVLWVVGQEYDSSHQFATGSVLTRARILAQQSWKHAQMRGYHAKLLATMVTSRHKWKEDQAFVMDTVWHLSVPELEATARFVAHSIMLDTTVTEEERQRRADALSDLSAQFVSAGQQYDGANAAAVQKLKDAVLKERQRKVNDAYNNGGTGSNSKS